MPKWPISDDELRAMYRTGAANADAQWWARFWGRIHAWGVMPRRWVTLEVPGRRTGRLMRVPLGMADLGGRWYLVSMLGDCNWTKNVRADDGRAVLWRGRARRCRLVEVPPGQAGPILQRYVDRVPGGRPHIPVPKGAPLADFDAVAGRYPAFEVFADDGTTPYTPPRSWFPIVAAVGAVALLARR
ncbi:MAG: nitroreductase family deazaflavin-dependent oxidoreductase [Acidimicrobiales bacterium]|nr:nitroreductase family deazaflavin-dependent oxidoreductase [Acidimicrobiales bacterium]MCB9394959.1 nitroreductase family deazaflavin-dependent oxidoreductase [Acidimicrobiaceae bacterium]